VTSGTSLAAAHISGVVALLLERKPDLSPADVRRLLMATAADLGPRGRDDMFGAGLIDAVRAVTEAGPKPVEAVSSSAVR
jgi:subtilisin family serine protease